MLLAGFEPGFSGVGSNCSAAVVKPLTNITNLMVGPNINTSNWIQVEQNAEGNLIKLRTDWLKLVTWLPASNPNVWIG